MSKQIGVNLKPVAFWIVVIANILVWPILFIGMVPLVMICDAGCSAPASAAIDAVVLVSKIGPLFFGLWALWESRHRRRGWVLVLCSVPFLIALCMLAAITIIASS